MDDQARVTLSRFVRLRLALFGAVLIVLGLSIYAFAIIVSLIRLAVLQSPQAVQFVANLLWYSGLPTSLGVMLVAIDLFIFLPAKRRHERRIEGCPPSPQKLAVALMSYNDEASIGLAVRDFIAHPMVARVIVVDNNSNDNSAAKAAEAGAIVVTETRPGYGSCVYRCLQELYERGGTDFVVLCEGDMTFRARDVEKLATFAPHGDIVNGTRIVEQLRAYNTQISTSMYYGNFFVGKLLEIKHIGNGTFTDVGTTYKLIRRDILSQLLPQLDPSINLEFNAHFLDRALSLGYLVLECPITFHRRIGVSKGGNVNNFRAAKVGARMILGLLSDWRFRR